MNGTIACLIAALGLLASAWLAGQAAAKPAAPKTIRVLWIGNSYTAGGRLPELVAEMVNESKTGLRMISKRALSGGRPKGPEGFGRRREPPEPGLLEPGAPKGRNTTAPLTPERRPAASFQPGCG